jgi:TonB family protein
VAHAVLVVILLILRTPVTMVVPGPDVVQVALVDPTAAIAPAPVPPPEKPVQTPPEIKPEEDVGVKIERDRPRPKPKQAEPQKPPPATPAARPTLSSAQVGPAGLSGDLSVDTGNFEFTYYLMLIRNQIAANWTSPAGLSTGGNPVRAVVYFRVRRGGEILGVQLESASGFEFFDRSALRAVTVSDPLPPLPLGFSGGELGIHFGFEWESP